MSDQNTSENKQVKTSQAVANESASSETKSSVSLSAPSYNIANDGDPTAGADLAKSSKPEKSHIAKPPTKPTGEQSQDIVYTKKTAKLSQFKAKAYDESTKDDFAQKLQKEKDKN